MSATRTPPEVGQIVSELLTTLVDSKCLETLSPQIVPSEYFDDLQALRPHRHSATLALSAYGRLCQPAAERPSHFSASARVVWGWCPDTRRVGLYLMIPETDMRDRRQSGAPGTLGEMIDRSKACWFLLVELEDGPRGS